MPDDDIRALAHLYGPDNQSAKERLARTIINRKNNIAKAYDLADDYFHVPKQALAAIGAGDADVGRRVFDKLFDGSVAVDGERIVGSKILRKIGHGNLHAGAAVLDRFIELAHQASRAA